MDQKDVIGKLPIVYSCSGCSSAAQMANSLAVKLDREGLAEMSCIAGVGGDVVPLVNTAKSGRPIVAIDGCPLSCCKKCLSRHNLVPFQHYDLSKMNVKKMLHQEFDQEKASQVYQEIKSRLVQK